MQIGLGLWLGTRQVGGFSPATLFAAGEPGGWYDSSDLSTMFQDSAGTTPVTATGQTVGLMLDKSQGLALGPELVTNGDFASATGWTLGTGWSIGGGVATTEAGTSGSLSTLVTVVAGRTYRVDYTITSWVSGQAIPSFAGGTAVNGPPSGTGVGTRTVFLVAATGNTTFRIIKNASADSFSIDNISVKELAGNHLTQATAASRPQYQIDANGLPYLLFDGTDDWFISPTITPGIDKAQVFAGVRKLSDAAAGALVESSASTANNPGVVGIFAPGGAAANYSYRSQGSAVGNISTTPSTFASPITNVLTGIGDIAADTAILRVNGTQVATSATDQGTGNYLAYPLYVGRRGGTSLPFNGRLYQLLVRFGANLDASTIAATETFVNSRTGAF